jgi:hypothetical protein
MPNNHTIPHDWLQVILNISFVIPISLCVQPNREMKSYIFNECFIKIDKDIGAIRVSPLVPYSGDQDHPGKPKPGKVGNFNPSSKGLILQST